MKKMQGNVFKQIQDLQQMQNTTYRFRLLRDLPGCEANAVFTSNKDLMIYPENMRMIPNHLVFNMIEVEDDYLGTWFARLENPADLDDF